jgi:hypothetical protein
MPLSVNAKSIQLHDFAIYAAHPHAEVKHALWRAKGSTPATADINNKRSNS